MLRGNKLHFFCTFSSVVFLVWLVFFLTLLVDTEFPLRRYLLPAMLLGCLGGQNGKLCEVYLESALLKQMICE